MILEVVSVGATADPDTVRVVFAGLHCRRFPVVGLKREQPRVGDRFQRLTGT